MTIMFDEFLLKLSKLELDAKLKGFRSNELNVMFSKSSGEHILALLHHDNVIEYMKWE